ncbi:MAG: FkbM family methyltransferase [Treponema sp.]|nr:FkbM family methyltransferase [Treponema sp.]
MQNEKKRLHEDYDRLLEEQNQLRQERDAFLASWSFRLGRMLTWFPRKVRNVLRKLIMLNKNQNSFQDDFYALEPFRKDIVQRYLKETFLPLKSYQQYMRNAKAKGIFFSAEAAQDIMAYLFFLGKSDGFYIEIGANGGRNGSTTFWAEQLGWKGICVEPQEEAFKRLSKHRNCALYKFAISDKRKQIEFISFPERDTRSGIADTMTPKHIDEAKKVSSVKIEIIDTITFNNMMKDFPDVNYIDFLTIDTEGHEMNVLKSINFDKYSFGFIAIEARENSDVVKFMNTMGYKLLLRAHCDIILVPQEFQPLYRKLNGRCYEINC